MQFQIWRPLTAVLYFPMSGPSGFHYLMNLYFLYSYSTRLETGKCQFSIIIFLIYLYLLLVFKNKRIHVNSLINTSYLSFLKEFYMFDNNYTIMKCYENFIVLTARCGKISLKNKTGLSVHVCMYLPISAQNFVCCRYFWWEACRDGLYADLQLAVSCCILDCWFWSVKQMLI